MKELEKQILKNQMLIMDMLAYLIDKNDMFLCRYYNARMLANREINNTNILIEEAKGDK